MNLGFNFGGIEELFGEMLDRSIRERTTVNYQFLEIGTATGRTLVSVADRLRDTLVTWRATSIDLVDGPYFNAKEFFKMSLAHQVSIEFCGSCRNEPFVADVQKNDIRVLLLKSPDKRAICAPSSLNFVLIDGCHGSPCVEADFLSVEKAVCPGGIVAFHDSGERDQGGGMQAHCGQPINVRSAIDNLDLYPVDANAAWSTKRDGWRYVASMEGDKEKSGNGIIFFQKQSVKGNAYQEGFSGERI